MDYRRLDSASYLPKEVSYIDWQKMHNLYDRLAGQVNVALVGPKGCGKTLSLLSWAYARTVPVVTVDCSEDMRRSSLIGHYIVQGGDTPFLLGALPTAVDIANEVGNCLLLLEEVNALPPASQKILNPITDFRRKVEVPETGKVFGLNQDARLWVCATMNLSHYGGVHALNEDLRSRFEFVEFGYPPLAQEKALLSETLDAPYLDQLLELASLTRTDGVGYALSTRDLISFLTVSHCTDLQQALTLLVGKYEHDDVAIVCRWIYAIFGIDLSR